MSVTTRSIPSSWLTQAVRVLLVGAGGTGSRVLEQLLCLHRAMLAKGHPYGLDVTVMDMDTVSESNIGRQAFYPCDVGQYKAITLVNRANMALGEMGSWDAAVEQLNEDTDLTSYHLVIGAVDNRVARKAIALAGSKDSYRRGSPLWWLDFGNRSNDGQAILGEIEARYQSPRSRDKNRLPHVGDLYPELLDPSKEHEDDTPSCSLAEALEKQSLYVNQAVSVQGMNILWNLFTKGEISVHGAFVNLDTCTVTPLRVDPEQWARFGVGPLAKKRRVRKVSASS